MSSLLKWEKIEKEENQKKWKNLKIRTKKYLKRKYFKNYATRSKNSNIR